LGLAHGHTIDTCTHARAKLTLWCMMSVSLKREVKRKAAKFPAMKKQNIQSPLETRLNPIFCSVVCLDLPSLSIVQVRITEKMFVLACVVRVAYV